MNYNRDDYMATDLTECDLWQQEANALAAQESTEEEGLFPWPFEKIAELMMLSAKADAEHARRIATEITETKEEVLHGQS